MKRILLPSLTRRYDIITNTYVPKVDLNPATEWGEVVVVSEPDEDGWVAAQQRVQTFELEYDDHIVATGDVTLLAILIARAIIEFGMAKVLRWNRATHEYEVKEVTT